PGTDRGEVLLGDLDGLLHLLLGIEKGLVDHCGSSSRGCCLWPARHDCSLASKDRQPAVTNVPIFSPRRARVTLPSPSMPKTTIGRPFSMQRLNAAASTTRSPLRSACSY